MIGRRALIHWLVAGSAFLATSGHTPYRQWAIYRRKHLLILTLKGDGSYPLGKRLAQSLAEILPDSAARVTRAPHGERVASLLATRQLELALLTPALVEALVETQAIPLTLLGLVEDYWLVAHRDFPANHAYRVVAALDGAGGALSVAFRGVSAANSGLALHPGAMIYQQGGEPPPVVVDHDDQDNHGHQH